MEVVPTASTAATAASSASDAHHKDRRDDTTEEYPIAEDAQDDGNNSDNASRPPSGCDENQDGNVKQGGADTKKQNGVRRKKRKRKKREQPIPLPVVGEGEVLVPIHTVWSRGKRMKGGHVVKRDDTVERYIDSKGTVYNRDGKGFQHATFSSHRLHSFSAVERYVGSKGAVYNRDGKRCQHATFSSHKLRTVLVQRRGRSTAKAPSTTATVRGSHILLSLRI